MSMAGTGLYHIRRKPSSSGSSLGRSNLPFTAAAVRPAAAAAAEARKRRRFIVTSFYPRGRCGQLGVQLAFGSSLRGLPQAVVETCQPVVRRWIFGIQLNAAPDLPGRFVDGAPLFEQSAQLEVGLPELAIA